MVNNAIPCNSDQVGPAISRGSPAGSRFASWHLTITSSRSSKARRPGGEQLGFVTLVQFGAEHHLVIVGVGDGPADVVRPLSSTCRVRLPGLLQ